MTVKVFCVSVKYQQSRAVVIFEMKEKAHGRICFNGLGRRVGIKILGVAQHRIYPMMLHISMRCLVAQHAPISWLATVTSRNTKRSPAGTGTFAPNPCSSSN